MKVLLCVASKQAFLKMAGRKGAADSYLRLILFWITNIFTILLTHYLIEIKISTDVFTAFRVKAKLPESLKQCPFFQIRAFSSLLLLLFPNKVLTKRLQMHKIYSSNKYKINYIHRQSIITAPNRGLIDFGTKIA